MRREYAIKDYAIIGNCETAALINPDGGIDWLCLPAFDAPSLFGALLDREKGGDFSIQPAGEFTVERRYEDDSAIIETRFITARGTVRLTDFLMIAREPRARFYDFTSLVPTRKLVRLIELEGGGEVLMNVRIAARPDYARRNPQWRPVDRGFACDEATVFASFSLDDKDEDLSALLRLHPGQAHFVVLDFADERAAPDEPQVRRWLGVTRAFWREWNLFNYYRGPHRDLIRRSAVTLKLLTYAPTGAFVAAPTTSLPEQIGVGRNWDYRLTWVRDTALFINTLFRIGYSGEAKGFFHFIAGECAECAADEFPVLLPIRGGTSVEQEELAHLAGYRGSRPVRRGNRAANQLQLDNCGHLLQSLLYWRHTGGKLDDAKLRMGATALEALRRGWREPDNGIWERVDLRPHTFGKVSAWLAFQRGRDLGLLDKREADALCREIRTLILDRGVRERDGRRYLADHFDADRIDASALLAFTTGFLPADLACSTREEIERRLAVGPWLYRSERHREIGEGAFVLCSFWRIDHLIREGELARAEALLEEIIAAASPLGLFAEEIDPNTGEFLGNFPQAFSHLGLIASLLNLQQAKAEPGFAKLPDHEKFRRSVGATIGIRGVIEGFWRVPQTFRLLFSGRGEM